MLQSYSTNALVAENEPIPINSVTIEKGCTAVQTSPTTVDLNKCGVYMVSVNTSSTPSEAGLMSIQLYKNGVARPEATSATTGVVDSTDALSFVTLVQVTSNNSCKCCDSPTRVQIMNTGVGATHDVNVVITKIC